MITEDHIEILRGLKLLRLENDDFKSVSENTVFFPLGKRSNYGFEKQVPLLSRGICEAENEEDQRAIEVFLERLGVRKASPYDIIQGYILPLFEDENEELNWQSKDNAFLIGCARYMRDNLDRYRTESDKVLARKQIEEPKKDPLEYLRKTLLLKLNKSTSEKSIYAHPESIYISKSYGNKNNLEDIFADIDNVWYVHDIYLEDSKKRFSPSKRSKISKRKQQQRNIERERGKWERFFLAIGLNDGFKVEKTGIIHLDNEERRKLRSYDGCTEEYITNYKLEHLDEILGMLESDHQKAALVFNALQRQWNKLQEYQQMEYEWFYYSRKGPIRVDAAWLHTLKTRAWIFTSHNKLAKPQEIFIEKPGIRDFLGATVPYVMVENEECARALGINFNATVKGVIFNLALLCHNKNDDKKAFLTFYKFLDSHFNDNAEVIKTVIEKHNLIFIPGTSQAYFSSDQVIWKDLSDIFGDTRGYLEKHYPGLRKFFVDNLGISERPTPKDYANALLNIREKEEIETKHEKVIDTIYRHLNIHLDPEQVEEVISEAEWWEEFSEDTIIWTDKGDFDTRFEDVYVNDHEDLYQLFRERPDISFFKLPARSHQKYRHLISTLEIPYLSQTIETEVVMKESAESEPELTEQLHGLLPYILRYIFNKANSIYENFKQEGSITELLEIKCYCLEKLEVVYTLGDHRANIEQQAKFDNGALYVQRERVGNLAYLAVEFAKLFENPQGLDSFLMLILSSEEAERENLLKVMNIPELPDEELDWLTSIASASCDESKDPEDKGEQGKAEGEKDQSPDTQEEQNEGDNEQEEGKSKKRKSQQENESGNNEKRADEKPQHGSATSQGGDGESGRTRAGVSTATSPGNRSGNRESSSSTGSPARSGAPSPDWSPDTSPGSAGSEIDEFEPNPYVPRSSSGGDSSGGASGYDAANSDEDVDQQLSNEAQKAIGRWGEEEVFYRLRKELIRKYPDDTWEESEGQFQIFRGNQIIAQLSWLNSDKDNGVGHDIKLVENNVTEYIEVKATKTDEKKWFDLSPRQWAMANEKKERFHIYRVYSAGTANARVVAVDNPSALWEEGKLRAYPVRIQL